MTTELTDFTDPTPDLTEDEKDLLRHAGASRKLLRVCDADLTEIERAGGKSPTRNSVLKEAKKYLREWESLTEGTADGFTHMGGGFFSAVWSGDLYGAYSRADGNNRPIIEHVFSEYEINQSKPNHRNPVRV